MEPEDRLTAVDESDESLGFGHDDDDGGYITGNETNAPDSPDVLRHDDSVPEEIPENVEQSDRQSGEGGSGRHRSAHTD
jgi:hypothetical protein